MSQITTRGPGWFSLSCCKKAVEVSAVLFPAVSSYFHGFHLPSLQTNSRVVAGLLSPPETGGVHQRRLSLEYPFPPYGIQGRHRPESGLRPRRRSWPLSFRPPLGFGGTGGRRLSVLHPWLSGGVFWAASARSPAGVGSSSSCSDSAPDQSSA